MGIVFLHNSMKCDHSDPETTSARGCQWSNRPVAHLPRVECLRFPPAPQQQMALKCIEFRAGSSDPAHTCQSHAYSTVP